MPKILRRDLDDVTVHDGKNPFGGGNNNILIHTNQATEYRNYWRGDILDETLIHEAAHTSLDKRLYNTAKWNAAVAADGKYISNYARSFPWREDIAETYLVWFATRCR